MGTVKFTDNGSFRWSTLASALSNVSGGAFTMAGSFKRLANTTNFDGIAYLLSSTAPGVAEVGVSVEAAVNGSHLLMDAGLGGSPPAAVTATSTTENYGFVISKAAGNVTLRYALYPKSNLAAFTSGNHSVNVPDQTVATLLEVGSWQSTDWFNGWIAAFGVWAGAINGTNEAALWTNWRTSDFYNSAHGTPVCLIEFNTATPSDLIGNATSRASVGTAPTLDAGETVGSWNFDGTGAAPAAAPKLTVVRSGLRLR